MTRLDEVDAADSISLLYYGGAGTGKTWFCGTAGDRTIYCDVEKRLATLKSEDFRKKYKFNPFVIQVYEPPTPDGGARALVELGHKINEEVEKHKDEFDTLIVDGATSVNRFAMNLSFDINQKVGKTGTEKKGAVRALVKDFPYQDIEVNDYQTQMRLINTFIVTTIDWCKENKKHFIFTAHQRINFKKRAKMGDDLIVDKTYPGFTGQTFPDEVPGLFDLVWHSTVTGARPNAIYRAETEGNSALIAKTCYSGLFPSKIRDPEWLKIVDCIKNRKPYPQKDNA